MTVDELLERASACQHCGKPHEFRRIGENQGSWAAKDGHAYRPVIDVDTVAQLRHIATGVWKDPWALPPKSGLERILARVIS